MTPTKPTSRVTSQWHAPRLSAAPLRTLFASTNILEAERTAGVSLTPATNDGPAGLRVEVKQAGHVDQSKARILLDAPVRKKDRFTLRFEARTVAGEGEMNVRVGVTTYTASAIVDRNLFLAPAWRPYVVCWSASADAAPRETDIRLRFGARVQQVEVRAVEVLAQSGDDPGWVVQENRDWRPIDLRDPDIAPGSALDFSGWWDGQPAGAHGRVIISADGRLAFANDPKRRAVFWGCAVNMGPGGGFSLRHDISTLPGDQQHTPLTREDLRAFAHRLRRQGYNLFRPHFLDSALMEYAKPGQDFDPEALDRFDYLVHCLKQNGVYLYLDAMTRTGGYSHGHGWSGDGVDRKMTIYHDGAARAHWESSVRKLLTHVNPYTKLALANDPAVAMVLFFNEQEIEPWGLETFPPAALPGFRAWLKAKHKTDDALRHAWTDAAGKCWLPAGETLATVSANQFWGNSPRSRDINRYVFDAETEMLAWYEKTIRAMGYAGLTTQFDCAMRYRNAAVRSQAQAVSLHTYAAPLGTIGGKAWIVKGGRQSQHSSIVGPGEHRDLLYFRYTAASRYLDRPFLVTEYDHEFWNPWRHERGLAMGGYTAFQDYDALMAHAHPVVLSVDRPAAPYFIGADPIGRAAEIVSGLLFARRDVAPARRHLTFGMDDKFLFEQGRGAGGFVWEFEQNKLALVTSLGITYTDAAGHERGKVPAATGYSIHTLPSTSNILQRLKTQGVVPPANRTDFARGRFETADGQLFLQRDLAQLEIVTPHTQGASLLAGLEVKLPQMHILSASADAAITISSLDGAEISASRRLLLVIATDALNSDMAFTGEDRTELISIGNTPVLVRTGQFSIALTHPRAAALHAWGLHMDGRRAESLAVKADGARLRLDIDTAALAAPYLFYEIAADEGRWNSPLRKP